ncbi:recombinase-like helix-turn-helix domain-containing protein [Pseudonocardia sp. Ae505_Ps2]|uniref:recombinase-like helix-turn-helix domain-containing protein n=1 Tax=Pseudonocardia sp. Ae505_Ps2 TaxID=1885034 RepID=UPI00095E1415|nr:recombinase-like helix-turn-helix domain-containing protein [Pseudonocardia sp. Ae505_Ps2]OLM11406.1 Vanillate O-demethylase oxygenase subunit [Pseudonocardia sp. Ae505_Ps2]
MSYLQIHQSRHRPPTSYETAFAAELERVYTAGATEPGAVAAGLNTGGTRPPGGGDWTAVSVVAELARLGADDGPATPPALDPSGAGRAPVSSAAELVARGLPDQWYALCPSSAVPAGELVRLHRAGVDLLLWRDAGGEVHVQQDRCPHRNAPLSRGVHLGDRIACNYHGVQIDTGGTVVSVPGSPGCALEGRRAVATFPAQERAGAVFAWITDDDTPPTPLRLPEQIDSAEWSTFCCYVEWDAPYGLSLDNLMDPMHGAFLHRESHSMFGGRREAVFQVRDTPTGFVFAKTDQKSVNFDWSEWIEDGYQAVRLDIPYPPSAGPGGPFAIIGMVTPIDADRHAGFFWRCRRVQGWERDSWRFLYRTVLEERHWAVLEQDRIMLEDMPADATEREGLYQHDIALVRVRRLLRNRAERVLRERGAAAASRPAATAGATR